MCDGDGREPTAVWCLDSFSLDMSRPLTQTGTGRAQCRQARANTRVLSDTRVLRTNEIHACLHACIPLCPGTLSTGRPVTAMMLHPTGHPNTHNLAQTVVCCRFSSIERGMRRGGTQLSSVLEHQTQRAERPLRLSAWMEQCGNWPHERVASVCGRRGLFAPLATTLRHSDPPSEKYYPYRSPRVTTARLELTKHGGGKPGAAL